MKAYSFAAFCILGSMMTSSALLADAPQFPGGKASGNGSYKTFEQTKGTGHKITLYGNGKGQYCVKNNSCGDLYDIVINGPEGDIVGKWNFGGTRGTFQWSFSDANNFEGGFRYNQDMQPSAETDSIYTPYNGEWTGRLN